MTDDRPGVPLTLIRPEGRRVMPKYVTERDIPEAKLSRVPFGFHGNWVPDAR